jgi:hypothetical protein
MRVKVKLTPKQLEYALDLARQRNKKEKRFGGKTYNDTMTATDSHTIGMIGESIAAKYLKVKVDSRIFHNKGDDGIDLTTPGGLRIAVKTTTYKDKPFLRAEVKRDFEEIDIYILCYVSKDLQETYIIGYITRDKLHQVGKQKKFGRFLPLNWVCVETDLSPITDLKGQ